MLLTRSSMAGADFGQGSGEGNQSSYHFLGRLAKFKKLPHSENSTHRKAEVGGWGFVSFYFDLATLVAVIGRFTKMFSRSHLHFSTY